MQKPMYKGKPPTPPNCVVGWPKTAIGYPHCTHTPKETSQVAPNIFQYCCPPVSLEMRDISGVQVRRHNYRDNVPKPKGVHSYYNVMWDGRVFRGDPLKKQLKKEEEECAKILERLNRPRTSKPLGAHRRELAHKKVEESEEEAQKRAQMRYAQLSISSLITQEPTKYMQDLSEEIDVLDPCYKGKRLQTLRNFPVAPSRASNLVDSTTQVLPNEFFHFDEEAQPVIERLLGAVVERARWELLEEEELSALLNQEKRHFQLIQNVEGEIARWILREKNRALELERQRAQKELRENGMDEMVMFYNICAFSGTLTKDAINECIASLMKEGFLISGIKAIVEQNFLPWLNDEVEEEIKFQDVTRFLLNVVVTDVVNMREEQFAEALWKDAYENFKKYKEGGVGKSDPPPTPGTSLAEDESEEEQEELSKTFLNST